MNNEEKILEMLTAMQARQEKTEDMLIAMQGQITGIQSDIQKINSRLDSMEKRMDSVENRLDCLEEKIDDLTEAHEITRNGVNALLDWSDRVSSIEQLRIPKVM